MRKILFLLVSLMTIMFASATNESNPKEAFINRLYSTVLDRGADSAGLNYWLDEWNSGRIDPKGIAKSFMNSEEFLSKDLDNSAFIDVCYKAFMGRDADSAGKAYWAGEISNGMSRDEVIDSFVDSQEFTDIIGTSDENSSDPTADFVTRLYQTVLGREPDSGGLDYWTEQIKSTAMDHKSVAMSFMHSQELLSKNLDNSEFIDTLYKAFMGREADSGGKEYWMTKLSDNMDRDTVISSFIDSTEFQNIINSGSGDNNNDTTDFKFTKEMLEGKTFYNLNVKNHDNEIELEYFTLTYDKDGTVKYHSKAGDDDGSGRYTIENGNIIYDFGDFTFTQIPLKRGDGYYSYKEISDDETDSDTIFSALFTSEDTRDRYVSEQFKDAVMKVKVSGVVSGRVIFEDENGNEISIPENTYIKIESINSGNHNGMHCKVLSDGSFGNECYYKTNDVNSVSSVFNNPDDRYRILVYENGHTDDGVYLSCNDKIYKSLEEAISADEISNTIIITPEDNLDTLNCRDNQTQGEKKELNWSGTVIFKDANGNVQPVPSNAIVRITPNEEQTNGAWGGVEANIDKNGHWSVTEVYSNDTTDISHYTDDNNYQFIVTDASNSQNIYRFYKCSDGYLELNRVSTDDDYVSTATVSDFTTTLAVSTTEECIESEYSNNQ